MTELEPREVRIAILAFDGCMTSAVAGMLDALQVANAWSMRPEPVATPRVRFDARILGTGGTVTGSSGFQFAVAPLDHAAARDALIVPPMLADIHSTLAAHGDLVAWIARHAERGGVVASVCAGAFFLARANLLDGRCATMNPIFAPALLRAHPSTRLQLDRRVVSDGRILTAGSTSAFLDLALHLIDRFAGHDVAVMTAKLLSVDKNQRSQLPYFIPFADKSHGDQAVIALQSWLEDNFSTALSTEQLARRAALSLRSLNRRFRSATGVSPIAYLNRLRIEAAKRQLETSSLNIQEITEFVGYQDARSFSRLFRAGTGLSPSEYRQRFGSELA
jgi:transcriptional regulator GlxA family with amidase domain